MKKQTNRYACVGFGILVCLLFVSVFWGSLSAGQTMFSLDHPPVYKPDNCVRLWQNTLGGYWNDTVVGLGRGVWPLHPTRLLLSPLPPLVSRTMIYVIDALLLMFAGWYFVRGFGLCGMVTLIPAMGLAFSGYVFTLIAAGHPSMPEVMAYAVLVLGFLTRALDRGDFFYFAAAGVCVALGLSTQPDVMMLLVLLASAFGLFRFIRLWLLRKDARVALARRTLIGGLVTFLFFGAVGLPMFTNLKRNVLPRRESVRGETAEQKWEFSTNWSMPPEELLEFVAPCVFGIETADRDIPYWGRVGRSLGWDPKKPGLRNLKQHTIYVGAFQLLFAFYALVWAIRVLRRWKTGKNDEDEGEPSPESLSIWPDVIFWSVVVVVGTLLSLGRFFPLYRAFYALPYMSKIRCPIKFMHYVEVAVCFLFAAGLSGFIGDLGKGKESLPAKSDKKSKEEQDDSPSANTIPGTDRVFLGFAIFAGVSALLLFAGVLIVQGMRPALGSYWNSIGFGPVADSLADMMRLALTHGGILFLICTGVFVAARFGRRPALTAEISLCVIAVALAVDLAVVCKRYVNLVDVRSFYAPNPVAERINAEGLNRTSYRISRPSLQDWVWSNFAYHHMIDMLEYRPEIPLTRDYQDCFKALGNNTMRLWQLTNTRFILGHAKQLNDLSKHPAFRITTYFDVSGGRVVETAEGAGRFVLLEFRGAFPRAAVFHKWKIVDDAEALATISSREWNPAETVLVSGDVPPSSSDRVMSPAQVEEHARTRVTVSVDIPEKGILLLNDKFDPDWRVRVDGKDVEILRCNHIMRGVLLEPGQHTVTFAYWPYLPIALAGMVALVIVLAWAAKRGVTTFRGRSE